MSNQKTAARSVNGKYSSIWAFCFVLAYVSSFFLSGVSVPSPNLDRSYQAVLEYAVTHNFQFGRDIVFTFGPLGFLNTTVSQGLLPVQRVLFALLWSGMVAWSATGLARQVQGPMRYVFLVWFLVYSNSGGLGQHAYLVMAYGCLVLMGEVQMHKGTTATFLITFALLSLVKFTFFMAVTVSIILCALVHIGKRNIKSFFVFVTFYGAVLFVLWLLAGQHLENFWPWLRGSFEIVGGYADAMTIFPKENVLAFCSVAGAMFLASLLVVIKSSRLSFSSVGILMVTSVYMFLSWKSGIVRADGHVIGFIFFLPLAYSVLLNETFQKTMYRKPRLYLATLFMGTVLLCNWSADLQDPGTMLTSLVGWPRHMMGNSRLIMNSVTGNWDNCFEALRENSHMGRVPDLPIARAIVGKASVDVINYSQWAALTNNLNYRPRPVIQGYTAYTPNLQDLNLSFYRSEKRPQYLLFTMETIDDRFPALDDAPLLPFILSNYTLVAKEGDFLVMKESQIIADNVKQTLIHKQTIAFGESLNLPVCNNALLIMQVEVKTTLLGRVIKFLFQSPVLTLNTKTNGKMVKYRFIPAMAESGFIISPLLLTNSDVMHYYDGAKVNCAESISFSKPGFSLGQLSNSITVRLLKQIISDKGV